MERYILALKPQYAAARGMFSRAEHRGYTNNLDDAGRYSQKDAYDSQNSHPDKYIAIPIAACAECGATSPKEAESICNCCGDKDYCHGSGIWP